MEANLLSTVLMPLALALIMLGMGMSLKVSDFAQILKTPTSFLIGFANQMLLVPLFAWGLTILLSLDPVLSAGLILIALCPGGPTTNLITYLSKGNVALSVSLTAVNSILSIFSVPIVFGLVLSHFLGEDAVISLPVSETIVKIGFVTLLPILLGMFFNYRNPALASKFEKRIKQIAGVLFLIIVLSIFIKSFSIILDSIKDLGLASLSLNLGGMGIAYVLAKLFSRSKADTRAIMIESGIQNGTLAIYIASVIVQKEELALVAGIYSVIMFLSAGIIILLANRERSVTHPR